MIEKTTLHGLEVRLEPLAKRHLPGLALAIEDGALWELPVTVVPHPKDLDKFYSQAEDQYKTGFGLTYATVEQATGLVVGSTRYRATEWAHKRVEIGFTFIAQSKQRTRVNTEAKYLMLRHAFEQWQFNRVEFLTDCLNERSRAAIARLGAQQEGILRSHMVMRDGRIRDSVLFSIVSCEWQAVKVKLESMLNAA